MKRLFKALLLTAVLLHVFVLRGEDGYSGQNPYTQYDGMWEFEKAEYLERTSPTGSYQVKQEINTREGLVAFEACYSQAVTQIVFGDIVMVHSPFTLFCGRASFATFLSPEGSKTMMRVGCEDDELGKESPIPGLFFNTIGISYWFEIIDEDTIAITCEALCMENSVMKDGAIRSILKKLK